MKVLKLSEKILFFFDIFSFEIFEKTTNKYLNYLNPNFLLISQFAYIVSSVGFLLRSYNYLLDWLMALSQTIITSANTGAFLCFALQIKNISRLHDRIQDIVDDGEVS